MPATNNNSVPQTVQLHFLFYVYKKSIDVDEVWTTTNKSKICATEYNTWIQL